MSKFVRRLRIIQIKELQIHTFQVIYKPVRIYIGKYNINKILTGHIHIQKVQSGFRSVPKVYNPDIIARNNAQTNFSFMFTTAKMEAVQSTSQTSEVYENNDASPHRLFRTPSFWYSL